MNESGNTSQADHVLVGRYAARCGVRWLVAVGNHNAAALADAAGAAGVQVVRVLGSGRGRRPADDDVMAGLRRAGAR
jgi:UDP-N-acetylmuramyl pentapeptide synthase